MKKLLIYKKLIGYLNIYERLMEGKNIVILSNNNNNIC